MTDQIADPQIWQQLRAALGHWLFIVAALAWLVAFVCGACIPFNTVPGSLPKFFSLRAWFKPDSFRDWMLLNPMNVIFYSETLTPQGRTLRMVLVVSIGVFLACLALIFLLVRMAQKA